MSKAVKAANARRFLKGGMAGRHPGGGSRTLSGTGNKPNRPASGWAMSKDPWSRKPPKGDKP
jgi:hypothetical protein